MASFKKDLFISYAHIDNLPYGEPTVRYVAPLSYRLCYQTIAGKENSCYASKTKKDQWRALTYAFCKLAW